MGELSGRIALVTGGASGIGRASSLALAREGADIALTYFSSADEARAVAAEIEALGRRALALQADMTDAATVERVVAETETKLGPIDILFANAGGILKRIRSVEASLDLWNQVFAVNVTSTFLVCQAVLKRMETRKRGAIITMSSLAAFTGGGPGATHYAAAKGAIVTYTRGLAREVGSLGIRVNGVAPGLIGTRFHDVFNTPAGRASAVAATPLQREGTPQDVAEAVVYLASDRSSYITGETIQINGGAGVY
ncbi:3-oxoacyl-[acyl-carrier protein] reductase [Rhizobiales bacterium GAS191]|jgi:3-oxoacyl-[acyl-carrier protein] reductase|nr:3-oxoacyl-[acyl-carrier protein] reductase [Rhizobiales bacterium GAS113]SED67700.1 3-oxoacyl-[acyl-carrier protein] reductase [Rhizobiales bacterium GAS191]